eukprot:3578014-Karenia_brevis.AAC.1
MPACCNSGMILLYFCSFPLKAVAQTSCPAPAASADTTVTSKAALRPGSAALVRISAGLCDVL